MHDAEGNKEKEPLNTTAQVEPDTSSSPDTRRKHGRLFWVEIGWRFAGSLIFSVIIMVILYSFSQKDNLSRWEKRWFNVLAILFSSLVSLSVGSLLGLLGSMLRWPLLAYRLHKPADVDLILGISNPTGALKLIYYDTRMLKWGKTTTVVALYLLLNMIGRLSVATFGLTFDLNELPGIEYPVMLPDWSPIGAMNATPAYLTGVNPYFDVCVNLSNYATLGQFLVPTPFNPKDPTNFGATNISGQGLSRTIEGDKVTYSYALKEFNGGGEYSSASRVLHSSSKCIGRALHGSDIYEDGKLVGKMDNSSHDSPGFSYVLSRMHDYYNPGLGIIWMAPLLNIEQLSDPSACATTYLYFPVHAQTNITPNGAYWECNTCLTHSNSQQGIGHDTLFGLSSENSTIVANLLLRLGASYVDMQYRLPPTENLAYKYIMSREYVHSFAYTDFLTDDRSHVLSAGFVDDNTTDVPSDTELNAAHFTSRLPLLSVMGADNILTKVLRDNSTAEKLFITVVLEVRWHRAIAVLVSILVGQAIAIAAVKYMCWNVFLRDHDSYLALAVLLKTTAGKVQGRSTALGKELTSFLDEERVKMRYGTRDKGGYLEVDLAHDVEYRFPDTLYR